MHAQIVAIRRPPRHPTHGTVDSAALPRTADGRLHRAPTDTLRGRCRRRPESGSARRRGRGRDRGRVRAGDLTGVEAVQLPPSPSRARCRRQRCTGQVRRRCGPGGRCWSPERSAETTNVAVAPAQHPRRSRTPETRTAAATTGISLVRRGGWMPASASARSERGCRLARSILASWVVRRHRSGKDAPIRPSRAVLVRSAGAV